VKYPAFVAFVIDQMALFGQPYARAMFGGFGIYRDDVMFAIVADDRLYFKVDDTTRSEFESRNLSPFAYVARGKTVTLSYFEAPAEVFEAPESMCEWAQRAYQAAVKADEMKRRRKGGR
jgi:DNA transformation protein and related proteins